MTEGGSHQGTGEVNSTHQKPTSSSPRPPAPVWWRQLLAIKTTLIILLTPVIFLPLPLAVQTRAANCAYVILLMAVYWMTEALPIAVTALLPIAVLPWLDVSSSKKLCVNYFKEANVLFFGGLLIAIAVEKWGLHTRVALRVLMIAGSKPVRIMLGFMFVTGFLSMWLSNTACCAMMIPIAVAVLEELDEHRKLRRTQQPTEGASDRKADHTAIELQVMKKSDEKSEQRPSTASNKSNASCTKREEGCLQETVAFMPSEDVSERERQYAVEDEEFTKFSCALKLVVAYASNIGGTGTMIGCGPTVALKGMVDSIYGPNTGLDFSSYFVMAFPYMILNLAVSWLILVLVYIGPRKAFGRDTSEASKAAEESGNALIKKEYEKLGKITFAETSVLICFITLTLMWLTKKPGFMPGWLALLPYHKEGPYVTDANLAITVCMLLFVLPSRMPNYLCFRKFCPDEYLEPVAPSPALLDWATVNKKMSWSIILLLGGGFALADACQDSGLSEAIGTFLISFQVLPPWLIVLLLIAVVTLVTTFTSNVSCATIILPITAQLANSIQINPLYMMIPVAIACCFSYILPVSTPPNAMVFGYGGISIKEMIKIGLLNCVIHAMILMLAINTWGSALFHFEVYPDWAPKPVTASVVSNVWSTLGNDTVVTTPGL